MNSWRLILCLFYLFIMVTSRTKEEWKSRVVYQLLTDRFARSDGFLSAHKHDDCDLKKYCGGTFRGIINHVDYITQMGFNAIWISPIQENTQDSYHGYHYTNLYNINQNFGTEQDFKELVQRCHERDVWIMLDVVANHVGPIGSDYSRVYPFNKEEHYHDNCDIKDEDWGKNQWRVEVN